jgi:hypothetical protein
MLKNIRFVEQTIIELEKIKIDNPNRQEILVKKDLLDNLVLFKQILQLRYWIKNE